MPSCWTNFNFHTFSWRQLCSVVLCRIVLCRVTLCINIKSKEVQIPIFLSFFLKLSSLWQKYMLFLIIQTKCCAKNLWYIHRKVYKMQYNTILKLVHFQHVFWKLGFKRAHGGGGGEPGIWLAFRSPGLIGLIQLSNINCLDMIYFWW